MYGRMYTDKCTRTNVRTNERTDVRTNVRTNVRHTNGGTNRGKNRGTNRKKERKKKELTCVVFSASFSPRRFLRVVFSASSSIPIVGLLLSRTTTRDAGRGIQGFGTRKTKMRDEEDEEAARGRRGGGTRNPAEI